MSNKEAQARTQFDRRASFSSIILSAAREIIGGPELPVDRRKFPGTEAWWAYRGFVTVDGSWPETHWEIAHHSPIRVQMRKDRLHLFSTGHLSIPRIGLRLEYRRDQIHIVAVRGTEEEVVNHFPQGHLAHIEIPTPTVHFGWLNQKIQGETRHFSRIEVTFVDVVSPHHIDQHFSRWTIHSWTVDPTHNPNGRWTKN